MESCRPLDWELTGLCHDTGDVVIEPEQNGDQEAERGTYECPSSLDVPEVDEPGPVHCREEGPGDWETFNWDALERVFWKVGKASPEDAPGSESKGGDVGANVVRKV